MPKCRLNSPYSLSQPLLSLCALLMHNCIIGWKKEDKQCEFHTGNEGSHCLHMSAYVIFENFNVEGEGRPNKVYKNTAKL